MVIFFLKMALGSGIQLNKNFFSSLFSWQFWKKNDKFTFRNVPNLSVWDKNLKERLFNAIIQ